MEAENAWNELPSHLAVPAAQVWARGRAGDKVDNMYLIRLFYLQAVFLIEWTATIHGIADADALLIVSGDLLSWVNAALLRRERLANSRLSSLAWRVRFLPMNMTSFAKVSLFEMNQVAAFGLPAAGALARCIMPGSPQPSRAWQNTIAQTKIVRDLSILIGHMDHLYEPGDGNYKLFCQAQKVLESVIGTVIRQPATDQDESLLQNDLEQATPAPFDESDMDSWLLRPEFW